MEASTTLRADAMSIEMLSECGIICRRVSTCVTGIDIRSIIDGGGCAVPIRIAHQTSQISGFERKRNFRNLVSGQIQISDRWEPEFKFLV